MVVALGLSVSSLPIHYLGFPLTTRSMNRLDYEPLTDKICTQFCSWTSRHLSYVGRLQLIIYVITSISNFWCSAFRLPQSCFQEKEKMCNAFLWSGSSNDTHKAKVEWEEVCLLKSEGGLGIHKLKEVSRVFAYSLIWKLFTMSG